MATKSADVVICGAGLAGVSAAYFLAVRNGIRDVVLVDERPPLSLTSDHSTECYRNWWPGPDGAMVAFMNHSIDLLEELAKASNHVFHMSRRGYLYCTADEGSLDRFVEEAEAVSQMGAGDLRVHDSSSEKRGYIAATPEGFGDQPDGADLLLDPSLMRTYFPFVSSSIKAALHVRRAGWLSAQQLGMYFLEQARRSGVQFLEGKVTGVDTQGGRVSSVHLQDGGLIRTACFVNAAGPFLGEVGHMLDIDLPVYNELHLKLAIQDAQGILDRSAPLVIWNDPQKLVWDAEEVETLSEDQETRRLLETLPSGVHTRPEGGAESRIILVLWEYHNRIQQPVFPILEDPLYPEVVLRGLVRLIPAMQAYVERMPRPRQDGGYYTRTRENRPLIGSLPIEGAYLIGALSGFGVMAACAAGELLAGYITGSPLPDYAPAFSLQRYENQAYLKKLEVWGNSGQL